MLKSISELNSLILYSDKLLSKDKVSNEEFVDYKKKCESHFAFLITQNISYTVSELARAGLEYKVKRIRNPFLRWLYYFLTTARNDITFNAPYLKKHTESDYNKQYIFWTKFRIEGILMNLQKLST